MPIYEYACEKCQMSEEILQKFGDPTPDTCPKCQAKGTLKKVVTTSSFHLKGGGWYKDLYASNKPSDAASSSTKSTTPDAESKKESKVEKTPKKDD